MLILNILDDISNREFKIALVTLLEGLENVMFLRKTSDSWLGLEEYKTQKGSSSTVLYAKMVEQKLPGL